MARTAALDGAGVALLVASLAWTGLSAAQQGGDPAPVQLMMLLSAAGVTGGRLVARWHPLIPAGAVALAVCAVIAIDPGTIGDAPLGPPLGYANANGALFGVGLVAALTVVVASVPAWLRLLAVAPALLLAVATVASGSVAATAFLLVAPTMLALHRLTGPRAALVLLPATLVLAALAGTVVAGAGYDQSQRRTSAAERLVDRTLTERRVALWHDAVGATADRPLLGAGPGRFVDVSPVAQADADTRRAHSAFLQQAAEGGVVAATLLVLGILWGYAALARSTAAGATSALGSAALTAAATHATVDYVWDFPAVVVSVAILVGAASTRHRRAPGSPD